MNRREMIAGATASVALFVPGLGWAQSPDSDLKIISELPPLPQDLAARASSPPAPYAETELVGAMPPSKDEVDTAFEILRNSPFGASPIEVAQYFLSVGAGAYGAAWRPYAREWPVRANPVIFHFFSATQTKPQGDTTAWCAAFVNWCLMRARAKKDTQIGLAPGYFSQSGEAFSTDDLKNHSTNSASSGSFRCWIDTAAPQRGDIAVLANRGTENLTPVCRGQGHVAFFLNSIGTNRVHILGGNQAQTGSNGAVTIAELSTAPSGRFLKFVKLK